MRTLKKSKQTEDNQNTKKQSYKNETKQTHTTIFSDLGWLESSFIWQ